MKFSKPKVERRYVEVRDPAGKDPTRCITVYETTSDQIIRQLKGESGRPKPGRQTKATSPA